MANKENIINKDLLAIRIKKAIPEEKRLIGKIIGQVKSAKKKPNVRLNIDEKQLRIHLKDIIKTWEERKVTKIIDKFLEEIKASLQKKEEVLLWGYFSLKVYKTSKRKSFNPSIIKQLKNPELSLQEKTELEKKKVIEIPPKNRISFRASSKLKREIN
ncbi:HU family DNA-binding protein [endosymbiont GvMRE of Glomus versiforme]|uniref:HU family DNA-binding protein n=1 Tax=endosymbiont GvMRE of Glomus versiforme TaxID=2039283 RepID=UPI000EC7F954|nr:HU family DNA-binding protein [endosymbiont GvMRE of Glomus versiforme]RHZ35469.1 Histone-like DNA-binding protein [endosymbiont GvMRE of Glomus versiforme]